MALYLGGNQKHKVILNGIVYKLSAGVVKTNIKNTSSKLGIAILGKMKLGEGD